MTLKAGALRAIVKLALCGALLAAAPPPGGSRPQPHSGKALATACADRDGWSDAAPPARIFGTTYYVGTCGIAVLLVTGPEGHILIDGATAEAAPAILANIKALGFDPRDIKVIIGSHEHLDHMGGFAALKAATGASVRVRAPARPVLESGQPAADDPQFGILAPMTPVAVDGIVADGEVVRVGALALTAVATPGHTDGGTSWVWRACDAAQCRNMAYVDSLTAVSRDGYRFTDHPARIERFRTSFARVAALRCDILITPHPAMSNVFERLSGAAALSDDQACRRLVTAMRARLDARLTKERGG